MPLSGDPDARRRQIANLKPGARVAPTGNVRARRHGGYSEALVADVEREIVELRDALGATAPLRDSEGGLPAADTVAFERAARALRRYRTVDQWVALHGALDEKTGDVKPAARLADELGRSLDGILDRLGLTPAGRTRLGLDVARAQSFDPLSDWARRRDESTVDAEARDAS